MKSVILNINGLLKNELELKKKSPNLQILFNMFLYRNIQISFLKGTNKLFLQENLLVIRLYLIKNFFLKNSIDNFNFLFLNWKNFYSFFINFLNTYRNINSLFFFRLKLKGLGFVLKRYSKYLFSFLMAVNHFYYFFAPNFFLIKKKKKHIICLSNELMRLNVLFWHLLFIKKHNIYVRTKKLNGFIKPNFVRLMRKKYKL